MVFFPDFPVTFNTPCGCPQTAKVEVEVEVELLLIHLAVVPCISRI
jgi:hypothetical protein